MVDAAPFVAPGPAVRLGEPRAGGVQLELAAVAVPVATAGMDLADRGLAAFDAVARRADATVAGLVEQANRSTALSLVLLAVALAVTMALAALTSRARKVNRRGVLIRRASAPPRVRTMRLPRCHRTRADAARPDVRTVPTRRCRDSVHGRSSC